MLLETTLPVHLLLLLMVVGTMTFPTGGWDKGGVRTLLLEGTHAFTEWTARFEAVPTIGGWLGVLQTVYTLDSITIMILGTAVGMWVVMPITQLQPIRS